jgi:tetratricopeptide (TPR) repeat protein
MRPLALILLLAGAAAAQPKILTLEPLKSQRELFEAGKFDAVVRELDAAAIQRLRRRDRAEAYLLLGLSYERLGDADRALRVYQLAEGLFPRDIDILSNLARLLHRIGLDERALPYYARVLKIHPNNASANLGMAEVSRSQGLLADAAAYYERAMRELSKDPSVWRDYAEVLAERGELERAVEAIQKALELSRDVDSVLDLAVFERRRGLVEESYARVQEAGRMDQARRDIPLREALWRLEDGQTNEAMRLAGKVLESSPDDALGRWIRASVQLRRGFNDAARADLAAVAAQNAHPFLARTAQAMLTELRSHR